MERRSCCTSLGYSPIESVIVDCRRFGRFACGDEVLADGEFPEVTERMRQFVEDNVISGAVTLVGHQGRVVHLSAVGLADLEQRRPMSADTMFRIMSMTKPITATAVMILVDEGKLSIDDPVEKYIPAFAEAKLKNGEPVQGLKIRHLLTHTSGLVGDQRVQTSLEATAEMLAAAAVRFSARRQMGVRPEPECVRPDHRSRIGQAVRRIPGRADLRATRNDEHDVSPPPATSGHESRSRIEPVR